MSIRGHITNWWQRTGYGTTVISRNSLVVDVDDNGKMVLRTPEEWNALYPDDQK